MRADKAKSLSEVKKILVTTPLATDREIAEETWLWKSTVNRAIQEMGQAGAKDANIIKITDADLWIVTIGQLEIERRLKDKEELKQMRTVEISQVIKESTARYSLFRWNATDNEWGLKWIDSIDIL